MTILEACEAVLNDAEQALPPAQILDEIQKRSLYRFGAKDPRAMVSGTIRKHIRSGGRRVIEDGKGNYRTP